MRAGDDWRQQCPSCAKAAPPRRPCAQAGDRRQAPDADQARRMHACKHVHSRRGVRAGFSQPSFRRSARNAPDPVPTSRRARRPDPPPLHNRISDPAPQLVIDCSATCAFPLPHRPCQLAWPGGWWWWWWWCACPPRYPHAPQDVSAAGSGRQDLNALLKLKHTQNARLSSTARSCKSHGCPDVSCFQASLTQIPDRASLEHQPARGSQCAQARKGIDQFKIQLAQVSPAGGMQFKRTRALLLRACWSWGPACRPRCSCTPRVPTKRAVLASLWQTTPPRNARWLTRQGRQDVGSGAALGSLAPEPSRLHGEGRRRYAPALSSRPSPLHGQSPSR